MSVTVNVAEAKAQLSKLLDRAVAGEEVVIARSGKPLARLVPVAGQGRRPLGLLAHWKVDTSRFMEPMDPEDLDAAEGKHLDDDLLPKGRLDRR